MRAELTWVRIFTERVCMPTLLVRKKKDSSCTLPGVNDAHKGYFVTKALNDSS